MRDDADESAHVSAYQVGLHCLVLGCPKFQAWILDKIRAIM